MNPLDNAPTPPPVPPAPPPASMMAALLKSPEQVTNAIAADRDAMRQGLMLLGCALVFHTIFGLAIGFFGGGSVGIMAAIKSPLIALCSLLLCLPSLYVFSSVGGAPLTLSQTIMLGSACLAMIGLLLIGLAPVAWLFAVSTESLAFVVALTFLLWIISVCFAIRFIRRSRSHPAFQRGGGISMWFLIFIIVSLQMTTTMRPLLVKPAEGAGWWASEKKFFLAHFGSCFDERRPVEKRR